MQSDVGGKLTYRIEADDRLFVEGLNSAGRSLDKFADRIEHSAAGAGKSLANGINNGAEQAQMSIASFVRNSVSQLAELGSALAKVGWQTFSAAATAATSTLTSFAMGGIKDTQTLEEISIQMQGLTHSVEDGNKAFAYAVQYFKNNPFNRFDVTGATKSMIQYGAAVDEIPALLDKMGKVSLSTGVNIQELGTIYQKTVSQGKVGLQDIYTLVNRGVDIWGAFAKATGKSVEQIREETAAGGVAVEDFIKAFDYLVDDNAMAQFEKTFSRQVDRVKGRLSNLKAWLAGYTVDYENGLGLIIDEDGLYRAVTRLYKTFADVMDSDIGKKLYSSLEKLGRAIAPVIDKIATFIAPALDKLGDAINFVADHSEAMIPILMGVMSILGGLLNNVPVLNSIMGNFKGDIKKIGKAFLGTNPLLQAFVLMIGGGAIKALKDGKLSDAFGSIFTSLSRIAQVLLPVIQRFAKLLANIGEPIVVSIINSLARVLEILANVLESMPPAVLDNLVASFLGFKAISGIISPIKNATSTIKELFGGLKTIFTSGAGIFKSATSGFNFVKNLLGFGEKAKEASKTATSVMTSVTQVGQSMQTASQELTKGQQVMKTLREGILNLILLAVAIAALAGALWVANKLIPDDIGLMFAKIALLSTVTVAMGAFAFAAGKLEEINWKSIALLIGLAADVAAFAVAIWAVNTLIPDDMGLLVGKLLIMGGVIVAMGVLAFAAGSFASQETKGLLLIAGMAGDLLLLAIALKAVDMAIPDEFGTFALKLANVGIAVAEMAILAGIVGNFPMQEAAGLLVIAGIAGDILLLAIALGELDRNVPDDFLTFLGKIGNMGLAVTEIGVLAGVIGAVMSTGIGALILGAGLAGILGIVGGIMAIAEAMQQIDEKVSSDFDGTKKKLENIKEAMAIMSDAAFGNFLKNFVGMINITELSKIAQIYAKIGSILFYIQTIPINYDAVVNKVSIIKECINMVAASDDTDASIGGFFKTVFKNFNNVVDVEGARRTLEVYSYIAEILSRIQSIVLVKSAIESKVNLIKGVIEIVAATDEGSVAQALENSRKQFLATVDVENVGQVFKVYEEISGNLSKIQSIELDKDSIKEKLENIKTAIELVSATEEDTVFGLMLQANKNTNLVKAIEASKTIMEAYGDIVGSLQKVKDWKVDGDIVAKIKAIRVAMYEAGQLNEVKSTKNKKEVASNTAEIINSMQEIAKVTGPTSALGKWEPGSTLENIKSIRNMMYEIGQLYQTYSIDNKVDVANKTITLVEKYKEVAEKLEKFPEFSDNTAKSAINVRDAIYELGKLNQWSVVENKITVASQAKSLIAYYEEIAKMMLSFPAVDNSVIEGVAKIRDAIYSLGQINEDSVSKNKLLVAEMVKKLMAYYAVIADNIVETSVVTDENVSNMSKIRDAIYSLGQINEDSVTDNKIKIANFAKQLIAIYSAIASVIYNTVLLTEQKRKNITAVQTTINTLISNISKLPLGNDKIVTAKRMVEITEQFKLASGYINQTSVVSDFMIKTMSNIATIVGGLANLKINSNIVNNRTYMAKALEIVMDMKEFSEVVPKIVGLGTQTATNITNAKAQVLLVSQLQAVDGMEDKLETVKQATEILKALVEFSKIAPNVVKSDQGVFDTIAAICKTINESIAQLVTDLGNQTPNFITLGEDMANNIKDGWNNKEVPKFYKGEYDSILKTTDEFVEKFKDEGENMAQRFLDGVNGKNLPYKLEDIGANTGKGFADGLSNTVQRINAAMGQLSDAAINKLKSLLGIASPSKVFFALGEYTGEGLANGLTSQVKEVRSAAEEIADAIRSPFEDLDEITASITGGNGNNNMLGGGRSLTINQNNVINGGGDYSKMMADLKWELFTA